MKMKMSRILACTLAIGAIALVGCESTDDDDMSTGATTQASMGAINDTCPISGQPVNSDVTRQYHGHTVGFCCPNCPARWESWSDEKKAQYIAEATDM